MSIKSREMERESWRCKSKLRRVQQNKYNKKMRYNSIGERTPWGRIPFVGSTAQIYIAIHGFISISILQLLVKRKRRKPIQHCNQIFSDGFYIIFISFSDLLLLLLLFHFSFHLIILTEPYGWTTWFMHMQRKFKCTRSPHHTRSVAWSLRSSMNIKCNKGSS